MKEESKGIWNSGRSHLAAHHRCERILCGAVPERDCAHGFCAAADRIVVQVYAACGALAGDIYARTALDQRVHRAFQPRGNTARAEGFQNHFGITVQRGEKGRIKVGREFDEQDMWVD